MAYEVVVIREHRPCLDLPARVARNLQQPSMVKIYDPHNLGVSCGFSENPPLPGWVLSRLPPEDLASRQVLPGSRRRWWQRLFP